MADQPDDNGELTRPPAPTRPRAEALDEFERYRGMARDVFQRLGGGEEFLRPERAAWGKSKSEIEP